MRRTQLQRNTPLKRSRFVRGSGKSSHARRPRGRDFMAWTSRQPCMVRRFWVELNLAATGGHRGAHHGVRSFVLRWCLGCDGRIEVDHAGDRFTQGNGTRAYDWTCIPLCKRHHEMRTNRAGTFGQAGIFHGYSREEHRRWCDAAIALHHELARRARIEVPTC